MNDSTTAGVVGMPDLVSSCRPQDDRQLETWGARLDALGASAAHRDRVLRLWSQGLPQTHGKRRLEDFLPRRLREALPEVTAGLDRLVQLQAMHPAADGSARLLVALPDGQTVESVLLPRDGVCVSTQVGCAVGCTFCMTGVGGLQRQLGSAEIVAQVALARRHRPVRRVVFMGMGEPSHNLDAVMSAITLLGQLGGVGHKSLVFSTVGDERAFQRLRLGPVKPALALSLHSTQTERRAQLLPRAPRWDPAELVERADAYARETGYPVQYQWTLLAGVNDGDDELDGLRRLLAGRFGMLNLIPWNDVPGLPLRRPDPERAVALTRALNRAGILTRLRHSAGQDVDGGCGQLRARSAPVRVVRRPSVAADH